MCASFAEMAIDKVIGSIEAWMFLSVDGRHECECNAGLGGRDSAAPARIADENFTRQSDILGHKFAAGGEANGQTSSVLSYPRELCISRTCPLATTSPSAAAKGLELWGGLPGDTPIGNDKQN